MKVDPSTVCLLFFCFFAPPPVPIVPDGGGGFVPITNSQYDPRTGEFLLSSGYPLPEPIETAEEVYEPPVVYDYPYYNEAAHTPPTEWQYQQHVYVPPPSPPSPPIQPTYVAPEPPVVYHEQVIPRPPVVRVPPSGDELLQPRRPFPVPKHSKVPSKGACYGNDENGNFGFIGQNNPECVGGKG